MGDGCLFRPPLLISIHYYYIIGIQNVNTR